MGVLFCISGIGSGHVSRCRPFIEALSAQGHQCSAAVTGYRAGSLLEHICPVSIPPPEYRDRVAPPSGSLPPYMVIPNLDAVFSAYQRDAADGLDATLDFFEEVIERERPDLVVVDQVMGPAALARARGIPVVQVTHPPFLPGYGSWMKWTDGIDSRIVVPPIGEILEEAFGARGMETPTVDDLFDGDLILIPGHPDLGTCEKALHVRPDRLPDPAHVGINQSGPPIALSYLSFLARLLGEGVVRGIRDAGCRAILIDGTNYGLPGGLADDPGVDRLGRVPIDDLWERASVIVHGGGSGIAQEALAAGVPQIAIPRNTEQETTARKIEEFGAGRFVPVSTGQLEIVELSGGVRTLGLPSVENLAERVTTAAGELLADDEAIPAALEKGKELRSLPTAGEVVAVIEAVMAARK